MKAFDKQEADPKPKTFIRTWRYGLFLFSSLLSNVGTWMQQVAQPWVMLTISHSSFMVGLDSFAMNAPGWILTLWGGVLADRLDRKRIILFFQSLQFLAILILILLYAAKLLQPWMLILISFAVGATDSLSMPSFQAIIPSLAPAEEISQAISLNSVQFNLSRTLGPALAGFVMAQWGALACFGANAASFIPFFFSILWIYPRNGAVIFEEPAHKTSAWKMLLEVFQKHDHFRALIFTTFVTTFFCGSLVTFCPVLIRDLFSGNVTDFGSALSAFGFGGTASAILAIFIGPQFRSWTPSLIGLVMGLVTLLIVKNSSLTALLALMFLSGGLLTLANITSNSVLQIQATNPIRGRIASFYQLSFRGGLALGSLMTGALISQFGVVSAFTFNGIACAILQLVTLIILSQS